MKKNLLFLLLIIALLPAHAQQQTVIRIGTDATDLIFCTAPTGRLYQSYLGPRLLVNSDAENLSYFVSGPAADAPVSPRGWEVYPASGAEDYFEPAFAIRHNDGNMTSIFTYVSHTQQRKDDNVTETVIHLKDEVYPVEVKLFYLTYAKENIIKAWTEIKHNEKKPVTISRYASNMLYFESPEYYLTEFSGDWAKEVQMSSQQLQFGKKVLETKLGSRAAMHCYPFFELGLGQPVAENHGNVLLGTIGWTGNFQFTFEIDNVGNLRVISGINPYASDYELKPGTVFATPEFIFTLSTQGTGAASRNLHRWARKYQLKDGEKDRYVLLNNWEATYFNFDEARLEQLMGEAKELGVDLFLLDDGWFGNKHPRTGAHAGLGDWEAMRSKLPNGIPHLVKTAEKAGVKFGIWIEPEMVNPKSELYEKHPEWVIQQPNRKPYYYRNQLVLDLANPRVQDYVFGVVDNIMKENPEIVFFKWDCNSMITNIYSPYLKDKQNQLYIDHVRGVTNVFKRVKEAYPHIELMLCAGGGGRCDYEALKYFSEFWCSDNTDPVERLYIQWGFSQIFPSKAMAAHVTSWNRKASIKFRADVAMMCKFGFDISFADLNEKEREFCKSAVGNYNRLKSVILDGDQYRLVSPYETNHTAVQYMNEERTRAVLFTYDINPRFSEKLFTVKLQNLEPTRRYTIQEINLMPGAKSRLKAHGKTYTGDYLMKIGLEAFTGGQMNSRMIEITAVD